VKLIKAWISSSKEGYRAISLGRINQVPGREYVEGRFFTLESLRELRPLQEKYTNASGKGGWSINDAILYIKALEEILGLDE